MTEFLWRSVAIGIGATALFDLWGLIARLLVMPAPAWALPGRWFGHMARGRFVHAAIADAPPLRHETAIGWTMHYLIGIAYAALLLAVWGLGWAVAPTLGPALMVGITTVTLGWFVMSPGMGNGVASAVLPRPNRIRALQLIAHVVFGLGLYLTALVTAEL